jgi:membrane-associated phospholipid phosphatase
VFILAVIQYYLTFGQGMFIFIFSAVIAAYIVWRITIDALQGRLEQAAHFSAAVGKIALVCLVVFGALAFTMMHLTRNVPQRADISQINDRLMQLDYALFGTYPPFWLQAANNIYKTQLDQLALLAIGTYISLSTAFSLVLIALFLTNARRWAQMISAFIACLIMSIPLWYIFPALSPLDAYIRPKIAHAPSQPIQEAIARYQPNEHLLAFFDRISGQLQDDNTFYPITSLPSMHTAWVVILAYFMIRARKWLVIIAAPYATLTLFATVYTMQHYVIDVATGLLIAVIAIIAVQRVTWHNYGPVQLILVTAQQDAQRVARFFKRSGQLSQQ